jgi:peptidyl-tRNA hydrolase
VDEPLDPREAQPVWAMQLAVRDDRPDRPTHLAVCEAAAAAVVLLLTDERAGWADERGVDGEWAPLVDQWLAGPIRKVVRRGRGAAFAATDELSHVSAQRSGAVVRAFVPGPVADVPRSLAKLQVGGTDMPERGAPAPAVHGGIEIALTPAVAMTTGKAAAQSGHAAQLALMSMSHERRQLWRVSGWAIRVSLPDAAQWDQIRPVWPVVVQDGGFTEVAPGTTTALACWARCWNGDQRDG